MEEVSCCGWPFDFVEPCEPDCTPERHAYHQGQWDMAGRINKHWGLNPHPTEHMECEATDSQPGDKLRANTKATSKLAPVSIEEELDDILNAHRSETWATGWNNEATEKAKQSILNLIDRTNTQAQISILERIHCCDNEPVVEPGIDVCMDGHTKLIKALSQEQEEI